MAKRKKKIKIQPSVVKVIVVGILSIAVGIFLCNRIIYLMSHSKYFEIKDVILAPSVKAINKRDVQKLIGKNIFAVDISKMQKRLAYKYPQIVQLKIMKKFPHQVLLQAKESISFAQVFVNKYFLVLDENAVVLSKGKTKDNKLPIISGFSIKRNYDVGASIRDKRVRIALSIVSSFEANNSLTAFKIKNLNLENISKINVTLSNDIDVIMDQDNIYNKIKILGFVFVQKEFNPKGVKYIDLRFKEPVVGKQ